MTDTLTFDTFDFQISPHKKTIDHESTVTSQHFFGWLLSPNYVKNQLVVEFRAEEILFSLNSTTKKEHTYQENLSENNVLP